jgi:hypothetical protein
MGFLTRLVSVEEDEVRPMLWACLYFFFVLAAYFVIRPIRDEMGVAGGIRNLPWLFLGTLVGMLLIHPFFTTLVSRLPRRLFICRAGGARARHGGDLDGGSAAGRGVAWSWPVARPAADDARYRRPTSSNDSGPRVMARAKPDTSRPRLKCSR